MEEGVVAIFEPSPEAVRSILRKLSVSIESSKSKDVPQDTSGKSCACPCNCSCSA
jgi:hypothetical protein